MTDKDNFKNIIQLTERVLQLPDGTVKNKSREEVIIIPRAVCCNVARIEECIRHSTIAKVLDKNRASIYYYERKHSRYFAYWADYRNAFNKVLNAYKQIENNKKTFLTKEAFKAHLFNNDIEDDDNVQMIIALQSGKIVVVVKTSGVPPSPTSIVSV